MGHANPAWAATPTTCRSSRIDHVAAAAATAARQRPPVRVTVPSLRLWSRRPTAVLQRLGQFGGMVPRPPAVASDVDDVAPVQQPVQQRGRHHLVAQDPSPFLEPLVGGDDRQGVLVAPSDQLEEQRGTAPGHRQVADLVDHQQRRMGQRPEPLV